MKKFNIVVTFAKGDNPIVVYDDVCDYRAYDNNLSIDIDPQTKVYIPFNNVLAFVIREKRK